MTNDKPQPLCCSFCSKFQVQVQQLIAGPGGLYICNECIDGCRSVLVEQQHCSFDAMREELAKRHQRKGRIMSEQDITQDPEYIRGYEAGIEQHRRANSPFHYGYVAGLHALETSEIVESGPVNTKTVNTKPVETITIEIKDSRFKEIIDLFETLTGFVERNSACVTTLDERLKKLEKYTQE